MIYIENEGAIFRGVARGLPSEVWVGGRDGHWTPYTGRMPKPIEWGSEITEEEAKRWIAQSEPA